MYRKMKKLAALPCILAVAVSCTDSRYDIGNELDGTIGIGGDSLSFPVGKTDAMTIGELLGMEENDYLKTDPQGNMYIEVVPDVISKTFRLDPIDFKAPETSQIKMDFPAPFTPEEIGTVPSVSLPLDEGLEKTIESEEIEIPEMVTGLYTAGFSATGSVEVNLESSTLSEVTLEHMEIKFPEWIIFDDAAVSSGNILVIEGAPVQAAAPYTKSVRIKGVDFSKMDEGYGFDPESHILTMGGKIEYTGSVLVESDKVVGSTAEPFSLTADIFLYGEDMTNTVDITEVDADVKYTSDPVSEEFSLDLPEELKGENTILDLQGAMLLMDIDNGSPVPVSASGRIASRNAAGDEMASADFSLPVIPGEGESAYAISENGDRQDGYEAVKTPGFDGLLYRLPSSIALEASVGSDEVRAVFIPGNDYDFSIACRLYAPLAFGEDVHFEYPYVIEGLSSTIKDGGITSIILSAVAESTLPVGIMLEAEARDTTGVRIEGIDIIFGDGGRSLSLPAPENGGTSVSPVKITVSASDPATAAKLDKLAIKTAASGSNGRNVKDTDYLLLRNISLTVPGGITIDISGKNKTK